MRKILLNFVMLSSVLVFAQRKELQTAVKAVQEENLSEVYSKISAVDDILQGKIYYLKPAMQEQYYYAKGLALLKDGKVDDGISFLNKMLDLQENNIYSGKDNNRKKVYFVGSEDVNKYGEGLKLKESKYVLSLYQNLKDVLSTILSAYTTDAQKYYDSGSYIDAAKRFLEVNSLSFLIGQKDEIFKYYAAISYALADKKSESIEIYKELINSGYTGVRTTYSALNKKTGGRDNFDKASFDIVKKSEDYEDFKEEVSPDIQEELYETVINLMMDGDQIDDAVKYVEIAVDKFPENTRLNDLKLSAYSRSGDTIKLEQTIREAIAKKPEDKLSWYNLGVIKSENEDSMDEAEIAFKKALELDPDYIHGLQGIVYNLYLNRNVDSKVIDAYNTVRKAGKVDEANKILAKRKVRFSKAIPYLQKLHNLKPKDIDVVKTLINIYAFVGNQSKVAEMQKFLEKLNKEQKE